MAWLLVEALLLWFFAMMVQGIWVGWCLMCRLLITQPGYFFVHQAAIWKHCFPNGLRLVPAQKGSPDDIPSSWSSAGDG